MKTAGIVAEYNPFHRGHAWQIAQTRRALGEDSAVVCAMSGHWVQGADCAVVDKWTRAGLALAGGVDLVLELPTLWAVSSAETFARGAVELLAATGVVDTLSFGSECGDVSKLRQVAEVLDTPAYQDHLTRFLGEGLPFAACRQAAAEALLGPQAGQLLSGPNNNLGVEYLRALSALGGPMEAMTVVRRGADHHSTTGTGGFASATQIRRLLRAGESAAEWMLPGGAAALCQGQLARLTWCERAILARLRIMDREDWAALPDAGAAEGLPERLMQAAGQADCLEAFYERAKTKRYTHARLRRLVLWAFLQLDETQRPPHPLYLRVLGMTPRGQRLLKEMKQKATLPILTKPAHIRDFSGEAQALFTIESRCTDLYALCLERPFPCGREYTSTPVLFAPNT